MLEGIHKAYFPNYRSLRIVREFLVVVPACAFLRSISFMHGLIGSAAKLPIFHKLLLRGGALIRFDSLL